MSPIRKILATSAAGLALFSMSACTSNVTKCVGNSCTVSLSGKGAKTEIGNNKLPVQLNSAETGGTADVRVGNQQVQCKQGETKQYTDASVTCQEVGKDKVKLKIDGK